MLGALKVKLAIILDQTWRANWLIGMANNFNHVVVGVDLC
jgi:hypothetical protein